MMHATEFGSSPSVTVLVTEKDDILDSKSEVRINWSTCGALPLKDAHRFHLAMRRAINFARKESRRLKL